MATRCHPGVSSDRWRIGDDGCSSYPLLTIAIAVALNAYSIRTVMAQDFPVPANTETDLSKRLLGAEEAAAAMQVPDRFHVSVFAAEPAVQNPIAMAWDAKGRLWVAENYTYAERAQRFDLSLRDRVLILEDTDGDGIADQRTVFTDHVQMLTSIEVGHGGVWLMCPPYLMFMPDPDYDDVPDGPAEVVLDGFTVSKENYHNFANGLRWGPDGWLYGRCGGACPANIGLPGTPDDRRRSMSGGIWRFHPRSKQIDVLTHGTTNPWGHDWDAHGEGFFVNTVNGHLWHFIPGAHLMRPFTLDPNTKTYELIDFHADHWHFDTGKSWQESRDGAANSRGGGHAHSGAMIYLGDNWPEKYRGRLFTWNLHGRRANQEILQRHRSGYIGRHGEDTLLSSDPFFRPIDLRYGPDGAVYAIDWSDTGECHENTGVHRNSGRVFRIAYGQSQRRPSAYRRDMRKLASRRLVEFLDAQNEWYVRQARLVLSERAAAGNDLTVEVARLKERATHTSSVMACRAMATLHAIGGDDRDFLLKQFGHASEHVRASAVRQITDTWPLDDVFGPVPQSTTESRGVLSQAHELIEQLRWLGESEPSGLVRLALASAIQRLPVTLRPRLAEVLMSHATDASDHNLPLLVWYGLIPVADHDATVLASLAKTSTWPKVQRLIARRLAEEINTQSKPLETLLAVVAETNDEVTQRSILFGLEQGLRGWRKARKPANWDSVVKSVSRSGDLKVEQIVRELSVVFGDGRALDEVRRIVLDKSADIGLRRSALETMVGSRAADLKFVCMNVLDDARLNAIAAKGLSLFDDPEIGLRLVKSYRKFRAPDRPNVISLLCSRASFANALVDAIAEKKIPASHLTAFDVRQIRSLGEDELGLRVASLWGEMRQSPAEKLARIAALKESLSANVLASADKSHGRELFNLTCAKCHRMYGEGEKIGPDLTGSNRHNLDYLLENILDPSAVVNRDFRMSILELKDGRVLNGLVVAKTEKTLTLQTQTDQMTIEWAEIDSTSITSLSPMPDGLLDNLSTTDVNDLIAYLTHPSQVPLPADNH